MDFINVVAETDGVGLISRSFGVGSHSGWVIQGFVRWVGCSFVSFRYCCEGSLLVDAWRGVLNKVFGLLVCWVKQGR